MQEIARLRRSHGLKWRTHGPDVVPAWVADMDLGVPPPVQEVLSVAVRDMDFGYQDSVYRDLRSEVAARMGRQYDWDVPVDRVLLFDNVLQAVEAALWCGTEPGDGVILHTPAYSRFFMSLRGSDRRIVEHPMTMVDGRWRMDPEAWDGIASERPKALLLCNPHNPLGRAFERDELEEVAAFAERLDLLVIADEVHADLVHDGGTHVPFATLGPETARRTVTVSSASKAFNIAGLRCAHAVVDHDVVGERMRAMPPHLTANVNTLGAHATLTAYREGGPWLEHVRAQLVDNRDRMAARLSVELPGALTTVPEATYLAWLDLRRFDLGERPAATLLERGRVALSEGLDFGDAGAGHVRLNFATTAEILDVLIDRLVGAVA